MSPAMRMTRRSVLTALVAALLVSACGSGVADLTITVEPAADAEIPLESLERLDLRVFTVADVEEPHATATGASGTTVEGVSCEVIEVLAPDATDCIDSTRRIVRDQDLVHRSRVPADGRLTIERPIEDLRIRVELPGSDVAMDDAGRFCVWTGVTRVDAETSAAVVTMQPRC